MICNTIGLTADSFESIYTTGGTEVEEVYGSIDEAEPIYYKPQTITGTSPLTFKGLGQPLTDYLISGNTLQNGTPSPDMPVDVVGCGVRTENLFDKDNVLENYYLKNGVPIESNVGGYVLSDYIPIASNTATISAKVAVIHYTGAHWAVYDENKTFIRGGLAFDAQLGGNKVKAVDTSGAAFIRVDYALESLTDCMINTGSTVLPYEPYGYKIPVTIGNTTIPIYIGSDPLYRIGDYADEVDFGNQRIIRRVDPTTMQPYETPITSTATIPQLTAVFGNNTLTVDTTVKPSAVSVTGNIKPTGYGQLLDVNDVDIRDSNSTPIFIRG